MGDFGLVPGIPLDQGAGYSPVPIHGTFCWVAPGISGGIPNHSLSLTLFFLQIPLPFPGSRLLAIVDSLVLSVYSLEAVCEYISGLSARAHSQARSEGLNSEWILAVPSIFLSRHVPGDILTCLELCFSSIVLSQVIKLLIDALEGI